MEKEMAAKEKANWVNRAEHKSAEQTLSLNASNQQSKHRGHANKKAEKWMNSIVGQKFVLRLKK
tara:strand:+ start:3649 stop:3840 length:192 start_codon:yes stop_codon:yes gene_type:complete